MLRLALAAIAVLVCSLFDVSPVHAQSNVLPAVDADGRVAPLTVDQLDEAERATYSTLSEDDARRFLFTRGYLRYARLVVQEQLPPLELPRLPERANWGRHLLSQEEALDLDVALGMKIEARRQQGRSQ